MFRFRDINQPNQAQITTADLGCNCINDGNVPRVFQFTSPSFYINYEESSANSTYNALQTSFRVNGWHGLISTLNYTWSHSIDDASDGEDFVPNAAQPNDSSAPIHFNRGNSNFDIRNRLTWNFIYEFPNSSGSLQKLKNGWGVLGEAIVPDDVGRIQEAIRSFAAQGCGLILTTGGTGLATRDVTPEAIRGLMRVELPGFGEVMRAQSMKSTPNAILSRNLAAVVEQSLVIALPGKPSGAVECLSFVVGAIPHGLEVLQEMPTSC